MATVETRPPVDRRMVERIELGGLVVQGGSNGDRSAFIVDLNDGTRVAHLVNLVPGGLELVVTVPAPGASGAFPASGGGMFVVDEGGQLSRYGSDGILVDRIALGVQNGSIMTIDAVSGKLAIGGGMTPFAQVGDIKVLRRINGKLVAIPFDYKDIEKGKRLEQNILLQPGDVVVVP